MNREYYLDLAASGLRMPIGIDLILHERDEAEVKQIIQDGNLLGQVIECSARRYSSPLAIPLMDLTLEKADLLRRLGFADVETDKFHFPEAPTLDALECARSSAAAPFSARGQAHIGSIRYVANNTDLFPIGMAIGPFSLMTKLMADPISAIAMAGAGMSAADNPDELLAERCLALAEMTVSRSLQAQIECRSKSDHALRTCCQRLFISPRQISSGSDIFERFVMQPNLRLRQQSSEAGVDLIFHDCGELSEVMVREFATRLDPAILSLGGSRKLGRMLRWFRRPPYCSAICPPRTSIRTRLCQWIRSKA